jgi:hypothetical protein
MKAFLLRQSPSEGESTTQGIEYRHRKCKSVSYPSGK